MSEFTVKHTELNQCLRVVVESHKQAIENESPIAEDFMLRRVKLGLSLIILWSEATESERSHFAQPNREEQVRCALKNGLTPMTCTLKETRALKEANKRHGQASKIRRLLKQKKKKVSQVFKEYPQWFRPM